jgi:hypothetical protein
MNFRNMSCKLLHKFATTDLFEQGRLTLGTAPYASYVRCSPHHHGSLNDTLIHYYYSTTRQHSLPPPLRGRGGIVAVRSCA